MRLPYSAGLQQETEAGSGVRFGPALSDGLDNEGARRAAESRQRRLLGQRRSRADEFGDAPVALKSLFGV